MRLVHGETLRAIIRNEDVFIHFGEKKAAADEQFFKVTGYNIYEVCCRMDLNQKLYL
jgi:hypothetical protein